MQILRTTERSEGIADYMAFRYDSANIPGLCVLLEEGQTVRDTYEVERFLGGGAFAEVYRVKHRFLGRQAMKVFKRVGMNLEEIHEMLGEAILLSRIGHPNIVRVFDANVLEAAQGPCGDFTMENIPGGAVQVAQRLAEARRKDPQCSCSLKLQRASSVRISCAKAM